jgi:hypothetical protein
MHHRQISVHTKIHTYIYVYIHIYMNTFWHSFHPPEAWQPQQHYRPWHPSLVWLRSPALWHALVSVCMYVHVLVNKITCKWLLLPIRGYRYSKLWHAHLHICRCVCFYIRSRVKCLPWQSEAISIQNFGMPPFWYASMHLKVSRCY